MRTGTRSRAGSSGTLPVRLRWTMRTSNILMSDRPGRLTCGELDAIRRGDVHYPPSGGARAALVVAADPMFATLVDERVALLAYVAPYEPGSFFRRELPATRAVLGRAARSWPAGRG